VAASGSWNWGVENGGGRGTLGSYAAGEENKRENPQECRRMFSTPWSVRKDIPGKE